MALPGKQELRETEGKHTETMIRVTILVLVLVNLATAKNSYTGGYSGAPGKSTCASSCHGGSSGTLLVSGFPTSYSAGQTYTITITHTSGNKFVNVNATTRLGSSAAVAGTFIAGSNSVLYTGNDGGIYASPHLVDTIVFQWKAPDAGGGPVTFYAAGFQGTSTSSSSGQSSKASITAAEIATGVEWVPRQPTGFALLQSYPNPFNPTAKIRFAVAHTGIATLKMYNFIGQHVATLFEGQAEAGMEYERTFNALGLSSGLYVARLESGERLFTDKLVLAK